MVSPTPNIYTNPCPWATAVANWCKQFCYGGSFYVNNQQANEYYAPHLLEILNEPYGGWYRGGPVPPADYANMLVATRAALNAAGFNDIGLLGSAGGYSDDSTWISAVAAAGGYAAVQGLSVHPYSNGDITLPVQQPILQNGWNMIYYLYQTYNINIYVTEVGWCINTQCNGSGGLHTEASRNMDISEAIGQLASLPWLKDFNYYDLNGNNDYALSQVSGDQTGFNAYQAAAIANGF